MLTVSCGDPGASPPGGDRASFAVARERATHYLAREVEGRESSWGSLFGYLHRRFDYAARDRGGRWLHAPVGAGRADDWTRVYARLDDPSVRASAVEVSSIQTQTDRMTALALHCDRLGVPANWPAVLAAASRAGGYALTHAALAARWTIENGCASPAELESTVASLRKDLAEMAASRDLLEREYRNGTDLWLEAMAMLYYLEGGDAIGAQPIRQVLARQQPDGGWRLGLASADSDPHATALALWVVLENERPEAPPIRWIPQESSGAGAASSR